MAYGRPGGRFQGGQRGTRLLPAFDESDEARNGMELDGMRQCEAGEEADCDG